MKRTFQIFLMIFCSGIFLAAEAEPVRQITWYDLIPAHLLNEDLLAGLDEELQEEVFWVISTLEDFPERGPETEEYYQQIDEVMPKLKAAGVDMETIMARRKEFLTAVVEELDEQTVRIPGYLLPLEISNEKVTEFLLVPYFGACIHVPPPPPNQIIYVKILSKEGYKNDKIFAPVWVTGIMDVTSMDKELFLVDGSDNINIGYALHAKHIEPYTEE